MENKKSSREVNWEKIGVYLACIGFVFLFWQSQLDVYEKISDIRERIAKVETKIENLENLNVR